jgi:uncharacterized membrane protein YkgB
MRKSLEQGLLNFLQLTARSARLGMYSMRIALFIVFVWIGGLKFFPYEADGIVPFVANSPFMSFFYANKAPEYKSYVNKEGELVAKNRQWHQENNTYSFANGLGVMIVIIGFFVLLGVWYPKIGFLGDALVVIMTLGTLSFLFTTPEVWVSNLGDADFGFPYLSGRGRLVIKDVALIAGGLMLMSESAQRILDKNK